MIPFVVGSTAVISTYCVIVWLGAAVLCRYEQRKAGYVLGSIWHEDIDYLFHLGRARAKGFPYVSLFLIGLVEFVVFSVFGFWMGLYFNGYGLVLGFLIYLPLRGLGVLFNTIDNINRPQQRTSVVHHYHRTEPDEYESLAAQVDALTAHVQQLIDDDGRDPWNEY